MRISLTKRAWRATLHRRAGFVVPAIAGALAAPALANHGPGTSGGAAFTMSGETLKQGGFDFSLRWDFTKFEDTSRAEAEQIASQVGELDALGESLVTTASFSYGVTDDFQVGLTIGYYAGWDFIDAESDGVTTESATADPDGFMDTWANAKYRVMHNENGHLAVFGGIKFPTGTDDETLDNGETLEPSSQPGSGAFDFQAGVAYSRFLTPRTTLDASGAYTFRTEHDDFTVGDRLDAGVAVAYRLTEAIDDFPAFSVFGEANVVWLDKDEEDGVSNENSGGTTLYLAPGVRSRFNENMSATLAVQIPVIQDLNGEQVDTSFKVALGVSFAY